VNWWLFAGLTLYGFFYLLRKENQDATGSGGGATPSPREAAQVA
jgi:hypothetical protein